MSMEIHWITRERHEIFKRNILERKKLDDALHKLGRQLEIANRTRPGRFDRNMAKHLLVTFKCIWDSQRSFH